MEPFDDDESITLANCNSTFLSPLVATIMNAVNGPFEHGFDFGSDKEQKQMRNCLQTQLIEHGWYGIRERSQECSTGSAFIKFS